MKFFETSKYFSLKKSTYIILRWIGIIGQLLTVNIVYILLDFNFNFIISNVAIFFGILSNLYLIYIYDKTQLSERSSFIFLILDVLQLSFLIYLTGGITNPFVIFLILPSIFSSTNLGIKVSLFLVIITSLLIVFLSFNFQPLPHPININNTLNPYVFYAIPISLILALFFLNYFAFLFGKETIVRKEAMSRMENIMAKEHELLSLGGQAAAAAHSLGTPLSTIKIIVKELKDQFKNQNEITKDIDLLSGQVERCNEILKKLSLNPIEEDTFIDKDSTMRDYLSEIILSYKQTSTKNFIFNYDQDSSTKKITKSTEVVYGLRNFIGNANKFSKKNVFINLRSDSEITEIVIEDDGIGYSNDIFSKIGEPYLKTSNQSQISKAGLGLGIFIGKILLEKNFASVNCNNSKTRSGAEVVICWKNKDLFSI
ncbi:MAG: ActS/PrrB/RegB family redox-sensitive histidine kinase [Pelagibacteraceae bacterium]|nr:ActS/PrrB/RegB family redox-sensitive histidine kinase [Pelagibacteraceae bacterium]